MPLRDADEVADADADAEADEADCATDALARSRPPSDPDSSPPPSPPPSLLSASRSESESILNEMSAELDCRPRLADPDPIGGGGMLGSARVDGSERSATGRRSAANDAWRAGDKHEDDLLATAGSSPLLKTSVEAEPAAGKSEAVDFDAANDACGRRASSKRADSGRLPSS